jgi:hypothetical protein
MTKQIMRLKPLIILSSLVMLLLAGSARAELSFVVTPSSQTGTGSNEIFFTGTLTNSSVTENLFLNDVQFVFDDAATNYLCADSNAFFANVPGVLQSSEIYTDVVFGVAISASTPPGIYTGTVTILGGPDIFASSNLMSQTFEISLLSTTLGITTPSVTSTGTNLVISWASPPAGFILQQNTDLTTTNWQTVTNTVTLTNGLNQVAIPFDNGPQFFRLAYP